MPLIVQKYGGTSVGDLDRIRNVARRVKETRDQGNDVVVVVSAKSGVTNRLIEDAKALHKEPNEREMDMLLSVGEQETIALLAIALHALDVPAVSRTGAQAGIITDGSYTRARIVSINGGDLKEQLSEGKVVIVAGFQGVDLKGHVNTLGRGGSDLSAIAIAGALDADICQIFTDVDGVYTADPRIVKTARKLPEISYDEMLELASSGSKVMQARSVEFAKKFGVKFEVRSSFNNNPGTIVKEEVESMERVIVRGVAVERDQVKVVVSDLPDQPGVAAKVFTLTAGANINVDMIVQNIGRGGKANLTFTTAKDDSERAVRALKPLFEELGSGNVEVSAPMAKLSVVGVGMKSHSGVASKLFSALAEEEINIQMISTSEIKITVALAADDADRACRAAHSAFGLDS